MVGIEARNNLQIPIRLTVVNVGGGRDENRILITIGEEGVRLKGFYSVCIDADLPPTKEWSEVGELSFEPKYRISISGLERR